MDQWYRRLWRYVLLAEVSADRPRQPLGVVVVVVGVVEGMAARGRLRPTCGSPA